MYKELEKIIHKPEIYAAYTAELLWADDYRSKQMLAFHLNEDIDVSSRKLKFINQSTEWMASEFSIGKGKKICDFGCGPGLYTSRFALMGAKVTGIDFSKNSIDYANAEAARLGLDVSYIQSNYLESELQSSYDLITMIMCDFCALNKNQRSRLLGIFHGALNAGGKVILDVFSISAFNNREESNSFEKNQLNHFWFKEEYFGFLNTFKYSDDHVILDKYSLFSESGKSETVYNWLQYYDLDTLENELNESGFTVRSVYSDVSGGEYNLEHSEFAVVMEKTN